MDYPALSRINNPNHNPNPFVTGQRNLFMVSPGQTGITRAST